MHGTTATGAPGDATRLYLAAMRNRGPLSIDRANAPTRHKRYPDAERTILPWTTRNDTPPNPPGERATGDDTALDPPGRTAPRNGPALDLVGELLRELLGVARLVWSHELNDLGDPLGGPPMLLVGRPAPSGGGLYPVEAYVAAGEPRVPGLPAALYHYDPVHHALERVRPGDHIPALSGLLADPATPDVTLVLSAVFWRSMFKYGDFGYRLICQETGVLLAQAMAVAGRLGMTARARLRFPDADLDRLLGLDGAREATLAVLALTLPPTAASAASSPSASNDGAPLSPPRPSQRQVAPLAGAVAKESTPLPLPMPDGPAAGLHRAGAARHRPAPSPGTVPSPGAAPASMATPSSAPVPSPDAAPSCGASRLRPRPPAGTGTVIPLPEPAPEVRLAAGVPRRASPTAGYRPVALPGGALGAILAAAAGGYPADLPDAGEGPAATALCLLALRVDGLPPGGYWYDPERRELVEVAGAERVAAVAGARLLPNTRVALRGAAAALVPVGDPLAGVDLFGDRWYRLQQIEAGLVVHRAALAAAALGLAARIHSDGANDTTDEVLGIAATPLRSLSFLATGTPLTGGPLLARQIPPTAREEVTPIPR
ncbi:SagB/ThcOx family dehydrogenase [Sphaerisporangium rhizosphaerae]|uniref:SagB family peptide dehydrogenase n=1 Tax=Sphaerisporangium rhizosphaerae TaxID=2269375 RepID=A0ABW2P717_9ACTN